MGKNIRFEYKSTSYRTDTMVTVPTFSLQKKKKKKKCNVRAGATARLPNFQSHCSTSRHFYGQKQAREL
jgi:hypothetical protein